MPLTSATSIMFCFVFIYLFNIEIVIDISLFSYMRLSWTTETQSISLKPENVSSAYITYSLSLNVRINLQFSLICRDKTEKLQTDTVYFFIANIYVWFEIIFSRYTKSYETIIRIVGDSVD